MLAAMRRRGFLGRRVEQDVALGRGDQQHGDFARADIIDVAEDVERRGGIAEALLAVAGGVPFGHVGGAGRGERRGREQANEHSLRR